MDSGVRIEFLEDLRMLLCAFDSDFRCNDIRVSTGVRKLRFISQPCSLSFLVYDVA